MLVQHHPTLLDATCWPRLNTMLDVGLSLNLLKIFLHHRTTLLAQQCCTMLASFEQAFTPLLLLRISYKILCFDWCL